jgi:Fe-S cluster assembly protein SufB
MLRISKLADYASMIMDYLARYPEQLYSAADIAKQIKLNPPTVSKTLKILLEAGLVTSTRGAVGGYKLAKPATHISVASIVEAVDGRPSITECCAVTNGCTQHHFCTVQDNWKLINRFVTSVLANLTLADMAQPLDSKKLMSTTNTMTHLYPKIKIIQATLDAE